MLCEGKQYRQYRILDVFGSHGHLRFFFSSFFLVFFFFLFFPYSFFFIILQRNDSYFLKFGIFVLQNQNSKENEAIEFSTSWRKLLTLVSFGIVMG